MLTVFTTSLLRDTMQYLQSFFFVFLLSSSCFGSQSPTLPSSLIIDDCCCDVNHVKVSNAAELNPLLNDLVTHRFFRYFKVGIFTTCPFWAAMSLCTGTGCEIYDCNDDEVPSFWQKESCQPKTDLVSVTTPSDFQEWRDATEELWTVQPAEADTSYINLGQYQEANTGYGRDGSLVWNAIYNQNCFQKKEGEMCLEERVFYRLISGMHTSITTHIARYFHFDEKMSTWLPNVPLYQAKVASHPDRIKNLYFAYLFLLRAVYRAGPVLEKFPYSTGHAEDDSQAVQLIRDLLRSDILCHPTFDETTLFDTPEKADLRRELKETFKNISLLMDCITCEKCKVFGKLQVLGVGTALKILLEPQSKAGVELERNEIIALLYTLRQFSNSISAIEYLSGLSQASGNESSRQVVVVDLSLPITLLAVAAATYFLYKLRKSRRRVKEAE